jgi:hypothetical protein
MDRMKDASEGGVEAATVPGVDALIGVHVPKHGAETLGEAANNHPLSTLGIRRAKRWAPIAGFTGNDLLRGCRFKPGFLPDQ